MFQLRCTEPDSALTIDLVEQRVIRGAVGEPDAVLEMSTETSNGYWQGKVNLPFAMARGKLLALTPLARRLFPGYVETLRADGRDDLIL